MIKLKDMLYEISAKTQAIACGGIGAIHCMGNHLGLPQAINGEIHLLKRHLPYFESDHVLNMAYNFLAGGTVLEDIELLRNDENYLNALDAPRIPDPTTAGDFLRRFKEGDVKKLLNAINACRLRVWKQQGAEFFQQGILDVDGSIVGTTGECKQGMDISYKGIWGYHPLLVSLANTGEPLFLFNRPGNQTSHEDAVYWMNKGVVLLRQAGFQKVVLRGDTAFALTEEMDTWDENDVSFYFGIDAMPNLKEIAENLGAKEWKKMNRLPRYEVATTERRKPDKVKDQVVFERGYENKKLQSEQVAEFSYRPGKCSKDYRVVVVRKNLTVEKGERHLFDDIEYFFYITNDWTMTAEAVVHFCMDRCNQENLIDQLKNGVPALHGPVNTLVANWAYMVIGALAWSLKAWFGLLQPHMANKTAIVKMEFKKFLRSFMLIPCQILRSGRRLIYRLLSWNPWVGVLIRSTELFRKLKLT